MCLSIYFEFQLWYTPQREIFCEVSFIVSMIEYVWQGVLFRVGVFFLVKSASFLLESIILGFFAFGYGTCCAVLNSAVVQYVMHHDGVMCAMCCTIGGNNLLLTDEALLCGSGGSSCGFCCCRWRLSRLTVVRRDSHAQARNGWHRYCTRWALASHQQPETISYIRNPQ